VDPSPPRFDAIYREHFGYVWAVLRRQGVERVDLEDLAHEVFLNAHRQLPQFEGRSSLRTWLHTITLRTAWRHLGRRSARPCIVELLAQTDQLASAGPDPEQTAARQQARLLIHSIIERLDEDKRTVFVLAELEGLRVPEIAVKLGVNLRTVYSRLHAARIKVRAGLGRARARDRDSPRADELDAAKARVFAALAVRLGEPRIPGMAASTGTFGIVSVVAGALGLATALLGGLLALRSPPRAPTDTSALVVPVGSRTVPPTAPAALTTIAAQETAPAPPVAEVTTPVAPQTASSPAPARPKRRPAARARTTADEAPPLDDLFAEEVALMARARTALRNDDARGALDLLDEHGRRFPLGHLAPERERWLTAARRSLASSAAAEGS